MNNSVELNNGLVVEVIKILPEIFWILLFFIIFVFSFKLIKNDILPNTKVLSAYGVKLELLRESLDSLTGLAEKNSQWKVDISKASKDNVIKRAKRNINTLHGFSILWFDDRPETIVNEKRMLEQVNVLVDVVTSLDQAILSLKSNNYDLMISDIDRGDNEDGVTTLKQINTTGLAIKTIFYIGTIDPSMGTPPYAFGVTNRPDELLHLIIDAAERKC